MSEDNRPENGAIPPRVQIKVPGQSGDLSGADAAGKKKTARLSLDQVTAEPGVVAGAPVEGMGVASKTIRLAPALTGQVAVAPLPSIGKALTGTFVYDEPKRQTSRIPLESVMPGVGAGSSQGAVAAPSTIPKTIKVKRPSISLSPAAASAQGEAPVAAPVAEAPAAAKNQTARVEITPDMVPEAQQTQKKTIKIRRADGDAKPAGEQRSVAIARAESAEASIPSVAGQVAAPHWAFVGVAAVALLVLCFMVYVLAAQAFPNLGWSV